MSIEPKNFAPLRILEILKKYSDENHPLTQTEIGDYLKKDYGIEMERKAISRHLDQLKDSDYEIESSHAGSYLSAREFENYELKLLIDAVLCSKFIPPKQSADLINKLKSQSNIYFHPHVDHLSVNDFSKTENQEVFLNIDLIDEAIDRGLCLSFEYEKPRAKEVGKLTIITVSPYALLLHNQRYYLFCLNEKFKTTGKYRLDYMKNMKLIQTPATSIRSIEGYESGLDLKKLTSAYPYMYNDKPERVTFLADIGIIDHVYDWFGKDIQVIPDSSNDKQIKFSHFVSPSAMVY